MEVPELHGVEAVKGFNDDHVGTPDRQWPLGVGLAAASDEGVRHQDIALSEQSSGSQRLLAPTSV